MQTQEEIAKHMEKGRQSVAHRFPGWAWSDDLLKFEKEYGKYLILPLAVEPIVPDNVQRFKDWFREACAPTRRVRADIAGSTGTDIDLFETVDSHSSQTRSWSENVRPDFLTEFPEIQEKLKQIPFYGPPIWRIWSSIQKISSHRDNGPWVDAPCSWRIMLYDENPKQTLYVYEEPIYSRLADVRIIPVPRDNNVIAWNNVRTKHGSTFNKRYRKAILIMHNQRFDIQKYANLLDTSISKYGSSCAISNLQAHQFYKHGLD